MGFIGKALGGVAKGIGKGLGWVADKITDIPVVGDIARIGTNLLPGGQFISLGLNAADAYYDSQERRSAIQRAMQGGNTGFMPSYSTRSGAGGTPWQQNYPDFKYWEPHTTPSDIEASMKLGGYEDIFMSEADRLRGREDDLFGLYSDSIRRAFDPSQQMSYEDMWGLAGRGAGEMGSIAGGIYFGGDAGKSDTFQGQVQQALQSVGQSGFGANSGMIGNAMLNAGKQGADLVTQQMMTVAPQMFGDITRHDVGRMQADVAKLQQIGGSFDQYAGLRQGALESAYGAAATEAELPFARAGERQQREFMMQAQPYILENLKGKSFGRELMETSIYDAILNKDSKIPGILEGVWNWGKGIFGGGGDGGGGSNDFTAYDYNVGMNRNQPYHEPIPEAYRLPSGVNDPWASLRYGGR